MDATLSESTEELAKELSRNATTINELNEVMRLLMKSALERMLNTETHVHFGGSKSNAQKSQEDAMTSSLFASTA